MKFVILFLLFIPNVSLGCVGVQEAPGYGFQSLPDVPADADYVPRLSDEERDAAVWAEIGYFDIAPSGWGDIQQISTKYYHLQVFGGGPGSCGSESVYIYRTLVHNLLMSAVLSLLLVYLLVKHFSKRKSLPV